MFWFCMQQSVGLLRSVWTLRCPPHSCPCVLLSPQCDIGRGGSVLPGPWFWSGSIFLLHAHLPEHHQADLLLQPGREGLGTRVPEVPLLWVRSVLFQIKNSDLFLFRFTRNGLKFKRKKFFRNIKVQISSRIHLSKDQQDFRNNLKL